MKANKFITLDIEGDASASQCRTLFPDANCVKLYEHIKNSSK